MNKSIRILVSVSSTPRSAFTPDLSMWLSTTSLIGIPSFKGSFPLRCFQRLSLPCVATQRCSWQNNWYTSGTFTPVLSY